MTILRVSRTSRPGKVAGAIARFFREGKEPVVQAIGPTATHQAIKAVIIARRFLAEDGIDVICLPELVRVEIEGQREIVVKLIVEPR